MNRIQKHLRQNCTISGYRIIDLGAEQKKESYIVYEKIKCHSYKKAIGLKQTDLSQETEQGKLKIFIEPDKVKVEKNFTLSLSDPDLGVLGKFLIENIIPNRNRRGQKIGIVLECKKQ